MCSDEIKVANNSREIMRALLCKCEFDGGKTKIVNACHIRDTDKSGNQARPRRAMDHQRVDIKKASLEMSQTGEKGKGNC
ncbi:hypothetical protein XA39_10170 [Acinetobacter tandoii]|nr:hypothetical protein XA39_10170 [Acinetobacter tandoii]